MSLGGERDTAERDSDPGVRKDGGRGSVSVVSSEASADEKPVDAPLMVQSVSVVACESAGDWQREDAAWDAPLASCAH